MLGDDAVGMATIDAAVIELVMCAAYSSISLGRVGVGLFHLFSLSSSVCLYVFQSARLKLNTVLGEGVLASVAMLISKVSGLCPLSIPSVGCVSTFDMNEKSG